MKFAIELRAAQAAQLEIEARRLGVPPEELARAAVADLFAAPDATIEETATRILATHLEIEKTASK